MRRATAPRPLDIDLLLIDGDSRSTRTGCRSRTPSMLKRRFVLEPLLELDPPDRDALERALDAVRVQRVAQLPIIPLNPCF